MSGATTKAGGTYQNQNKTPRKSLRSRKLSLKAVENLMTSSTDEIDDDVSAIVVGSTSSTDHTEQSVQRRSTRDKSPTKRYQMDYVTDGTPRKQRKSFRKSVSSTQPLENDSEDNSNISDAEELSELPTRPDFHFLQEQHDVAGRSMFGFSTPRKRNGMALAAMNTPKTPHTPNTTKTPSQTKTPDTSKRRKSTAEPKTPSHVRHRLKNQIAKLVADSDSDFSEDESDFQPSDSDSSSDSSHSEPSDAADDAADDEPKTPRRGRRPIIVPILPKTPSAARQRQSARAKKSTEYIPESENYFQSHTSGKILTSDHTLDRLKNPRLPADRLFSLLAEMKISTEHETAINAIIEEYHSYFPKWMCILNEGFNLLLYGLGSKRQLLQSFHRDVLKDQTVLVINGFFPSLTVKDILDNITGEILDAGPSPPNPHEAISMIEEEFSLIRETHLYLIVHNLDGAMLRNAKAQSILSRLASVPNIHLLASIDHINTPLLWNQTKLNNFNFSWWDCTTMLPYTDETAYENSLLVQNSGALALSSMRSVFSSLTTNARGIYMLIVKYQLKNKGNQNFQGMPFKQLYSSCRETFLVSSDLALRAQLTEFLDHKLVKSKRSIEGSEQLTIPIDSTLLQQFLEEQEKK